MTDGALLDAVIDRIVPEDRDPGALALGTPVYVRRRLAEDPARAAKVEAGLARLTGFTALTDVEKDALLTAIETEPWFALLVEITQEGFYANPAHGGNAGAASWRMIGYEHGLPDGPDGPPR